MGMDGQTAGNDCLFLAGIGDQQWGQLRGFAPGHHPSDHVPAEDVEDDVEMKVSPLSGRLTS